MSTKASEVRMKLDFSEETGKPFTDSKEYQLALNVIETLTFEEIEIMAKKIEQDGSRKATVDNENSKKLQEEFEKFIKSTNTLIQDKDFKEAAELISRAIEIATKVVLPIVQNRLYQRIATIISSHPEILRASSKIAGIPSLYFANRSEVDMIGIFIDRPSLVKFEGVVKWNMSARSEITLPATIAEKKASFVPSYLELTKQSSVKSSSLSMEDKTQELNPLKSSSKVQKFR